jgi:hypothetical protein
LIYLGFITEGKLFVVLIKPSLGVSNWPVIYIINYTPTDFWHHSTPRHQVLLLRILYILKDILKGSSRILNVMQVMVLFLRKRRRSIKQLQNLPKQVRILIVFLFLMLKPKAVMLLIKKKLRRNQKSLLRMQSTLRKISLPINMVVRENLGCKSQCLFLVRNTNPRKKNTITGFVNG